MVWFGSNEDVSYQEIGKNFISFTVRRVGSLTKGLFLSSEISCLCNFNGSKEVLEVGTPSVCASRREKEGVVSSRTCLPN